MKNLSKVVLLDTYEVQRKIPENLPKQWQKPFLINQRYEKKQTWLYEIQDPWVNFYGHIFINYLFFPPSIYPVMAKEYRFLLKVNLSLWKKLGQGNYEQISEPCIVVHNNYFDNYHHWLLEILPRLFLLLDRFGQYKVILPPLTLPFQKASLALFPDFEQVQTIPEKILKPKQVLFPSFIAKPANYAPKVMQDFSKWIQEKIIKPSTEQALAKKIFISRSRAKYRRLINQEEIESFLRQENFSIVHLEDEPFERQVYLFHQAEVVVASHGAGLTNLLFCKPGTKVLEMLSDAYLNLCYYNLAETMQLVYECLIIRTQQAKKWDWDSDFEVELTDLQKQLNVLYNKD